MKSKPTTEKITPEIKAVLSAGNRLIDIVEGLRNRRWTDDGGFRLKDMPEWCAFYVAWCKLNRE